MDEQNKPLDTLPLQEQLARVEACVRADLAKRGPSDEPAFEPCAACCAQGESHGWHGVKFVHLRERTPLFVAPLTVEQVRMMRQVAEFVGMSDPDAADSIYRGVSALAHRAIATACYTDTVSAISMAALGENGSRLGARSRLLEDSAVSMLKDAWWTASHAGKEVDLDLLSDAMEKVVAQFGGKRGRELRERAHREVEGLIAADVARTASTDGAETDPTEIRARDREERASNAC